MIAKSETVTGLGERLTMGGGSLWLHPFDGSAPVCERKARETCAHDWERAGFGNLCAYYECRKCGEEFEKDVS